MKDQLRSILEEELNAIVALVNILEKQHELLVLQDVFKLESITDEIDNFSRNLAMIEGKRRALTGSKSMKALIEMQNDKNLNSIYDEVTRSLSSLITQKDTNELLIKQSLRYTNSILAMIGPKKETMTYNGYGKVGK